MRRIVATSILLIALAGCGHRTAADNAADKLDQAAAQSDPAAAPALRNAADAMRDSNSAAPLDQPGSPAQNALEQGAAAQQGQ